MNAKRIVLSLGTLVFAAAVVAGGTGAFFSATETAEGNVFTAGTVSLDMGPIAHDYFGDDNNAPIFTTPGGTSFDLDDLKPLDWGEITFELENGANEAYVCAMVTNDPDDGPDAAGLALYDLLNFYQDDGTQVVPGQWFSLGSVAPNTPVGTGVDYCFGDSQVDGTGLTACEHGGLDYNPAQGGSFEADLLFYAIQTRNNGDFSCDQLTMDDGEPVYVPGPTPVDPIDATGPFDGWNGPGNLIAEAEGRFGNNAANGDWEIGVGTDSSVPGSFANTQNEWTNGVAEAFAVSYDAGTQVMTFTVDGNSQTYNVGAIPNTAELNLIAGKVSSGAGDSVALSNLTINGAPVNPASFTDTDNTDALYYIVDSVDLSTDFTVTGDVTFSWTGGTTSGSRPAFYVQVRD